MSGEGIASLRYRPSALLLVLGSPGCRHCQFVQASLLSPRSPCSCPYGLSVSLSSVCSGIGTPAADRSMGSPPFPES
ncbi:hypothetical protein AAHA92_25020 [Salvia divinorum]|uniref:Secreted protein n=1 Tax=Salvia divinorum TaxID=28513 RepID=A0ABD1GCE1_SALDI